MYNYDFAEHSQVLRMGVSLPSGDRLPVTPARRPALAGDAPEYSDHLPGYRVPAFAAAMGRELTGPLHGLLSLGLA
jgi:hypothetical protein